MSKSCVLTTLGNDPHTLGLYKAMRIGRRVGIEVHVLPPGASDRDIMEAIHRVDADYVGLSYRLTPDVGLRELVRVLQTLDRSGVLRTADGRTRKVAFAGLLETIRAVKQSRDKLPCDVMTMPQDNDLLKRASRVLDFFEVQGDRRAAVMETVKSELYPPTIPELDQLAAETVSDESYQGEPPLPVPSARGRESFTQRIRESPIPILRTHFGIPGESITPTVEGVSALAEARVIDEISLGSSDLSQRYFGRPEEFVGRKNDGGVPYKTPEDLVELAQATQRGNFPCIRPYAHVVNLVDFIDTCLRAGLLKGAHHVIPLYWFNELDGRGPMTLPESIREHLAAIRDLARRGIPVEINDPNQWSSRWAHDALIAADYGLIAAVMIHSGVPDMVLQMQFNKPRETGDLADLAKMSAGLQLAQAMVPPGATAPEIWRETRTGIGYFDPDPARAKFQLARSTLLQMMVCPHVIHVVSYCEANHAATVEDIIDSSRLVRKCVRIFRQHEPDLMSHLADPILLGRLEQLLGDGRLLLDRIAALSDKPPADGPGDLASSGSRLADPDVLAEALRMGYMMAPGVFHPDYAQGAEMATGPTRGGFIDCLDSETGQPLSESKRLAILDARRDRAESEPAQGAEA